MVMCMSNVKRGVMWSCVNFICIMNNRVKNSMIGL